MIRAIFQFLGDVIIDDGDDESMEEEDDEEFDVPNESKLTLTYHTGSLTQLFDKFPFKF